MENKIIKEKILEAITKTERAIASYEKKLIPVTAEGAVGRVSRMNELNNKTIGYEQLEVATTKLANLKLVLSKVGTKSFGICINCQKPISIGRILVRPESLRCVKCVK